jgi:hypothetical protein
MMSRTFCVALLATISFIGAPAGAATAKFDCDTAAKRFSTVSLPIAGQHLRVSGLVSSELIRNDDRWAPKLSLYLAGSGQQFGGFSISKQPGQPWAVALRYSGKESAPVATLSRFDPIPFTLDVNATSGTVDLTLGSNNYHGSGTAFHAEHLALSCSTGNFMFDELSWEALPG